MLIISHRTEGEKHKMDDEELTAVVNRAQLRWEEQGCPDDFRTTTQTSIGPTIVNIHHHESFPSGGCTFTADVGQPENGRSLGRLKIHIV